MGDVTAGKVHHWKHGWIPIDATAMGEKTGKPQLGPTSAEKIKNAETMYGTGSAQHKEAIRRFSSPPSAATGDGKPRQFHIISGQAGDANYHVEKLDGDDNVEIMNYGHENGKFAVNDYFPTRVWGGDRHRDDITMQPEEIKREAADTIQGVMDRFPGLKDQNVQINQTDSNGEFFAATDFPKSVAISLDKGLYAEGFVDLRIKQFHDLHAQVDAFDMPSRDEFRRRIIIHEMGHVIHGRAVKKLGRTMKLDELNRQPFHVNASDPITAFAMEPVTPRQYGFTSTPEWAKNNAPSGKDWLDVPQPRYLVDTLDNKSAYTGFSSEEFYGEAFLDGMINGDKASASGKRAVALADQLFGKGAK